VEGSRGEGHLVPAAHDIEPPLVLPIDPDLPDAVSCEPANPILQAPDPRTLFIQPWDKNIVKTIEKAIAASPLKLMPTLDGDVLRISIPSLTEEKRKELLKILKDKMEQARVRVRREREEVWDEVQKMQKESKITEDDKYVAKEELQKMVDQYNGKIEEMGGKKEKEIMTV